MRMFFPPELRAPRDYSFAELDAERGEEIRAAHEHHSHRNKYRAELPVLQQLDLFPALQFAANA